jgi:hypothetical protein
MLARAFKRNFYLVTRASFLLGLLSFAAPSPPAIKVEPLSLPSQPKQIVSIATDAAGRLYLLDQENAKIVFYSPKLEYLGELKTPSQGRGKLLRPFRMSICGSRLAVAEHGRIMLYSLAPPDKATFEGSADGLDDYSPSFGFELLPSRFLFTALGFDTPPPGRPTPGVSTDFLCVFSTSTDGTGLRVERREKVAYDYLGSWQAFAFLGLSAPWNGSWIVARQLPLRLYQINADGRMVKESPWCQGDLPKASVEEAEKNSGWGCAAIQRSVAHAEALLPLKDRLGVVLWVPNGQAGRHKILWVDSELKKRGETEMSLPVQLGLRDSLFASAVLDGSRAVFLVVHGAPMGFGTSELFISKIGNVP